MKDKWMNIGCEDDELKFYVEFFVDVFDFLWIGKIFSYKFVLFCRGKGFIVIKIFGERG